MDGSQHEAASAVPFAAPRDIVAGPISAAGLGVVLCLGVGLARSDGTEPWLANALALLLTIAGLGAGGMDRAGALRALRGLLGSEADISARASGLAVAALALALAHALIWLPFDLRLWPLGLAAGSAAAGSIIATGLSFARVSTVPRWSGAPTALLFLALGGAGGLLGLSAIENLLGFPPGLVVWKAALALIGAGLAAQLWTAQAAEASRDAAEAGRLEEPALHHAAFVRARGMAMALWWGAILLGLVIPIICAVGADFLAGRLWMPTALLSHLVGAVVMRWLFLAEAEIAAAPQADDGAQ